MSIYNPACDTQHIIRQAINSKGLGTLKSEENTFQANGRKPIVTASENTYKYKRLFIITNKDDLEYFKAECKNKPVDEILNYLGIDVSYDKNGNKSISHYSWPFDMYSFKAAGINEEELLKGVSKIKGKCNLTGSNLKNLGDVKEISGTLTIPYFSKLEDLSSLEHVGGNIICETESKEDAIAKIQDLGVNLDNFRGRLYYGESDSTLTYLNAGEIKSEIANMEHRLNSLQNDRKEGLKNPKSLLYSYYSSEIYDKNLNEVQSQLNQLKETLASIQAKSTYNT